MQWQDNEPITLDDTDDEEAGPGPGSLADAAQPRRSQRSNAFKGPMQRFQVSKHASVFAEPLFMRSLIQSPCSSQA